MRAVTGNKECTNDGLIIALVSLNTLHHFGLKSCNSKTNTVLFTQSWLNTAFMKKQEILQGLGCFDT